MFSCNLRCTHRFTLVITHGFMATRAHLVFLHICSLNGNVKRNKHLFRKRRQPSPVQLPVKYQSFQQRSLNICALLSALKSFFFKFFSLLIADHYLRYSKECVVYKMCDPEKSVILKFSVSSFIWGMKGARCHKWEAGSFESKAICLKTHIDD